METREEYKKKIALCDKLGAKKFQKVVLKVEEAKFKVIKTIFPGFVKKYEKHCDRIRDRALKKATTAEEKKRIIDECRNQKIAMRREWNREENRNYHMDENKPTEFLYYLNWNKDVHKKGLIRNAITIAAATGALALGVAPALAGTLLACEIFGAFINFQCVNIQNSHIYRFKMLEPALRKREKKKNQQNVQNYSNAAKVYARTIEQTMDVPTIQQMIENVRTPEELAEIRKMLATVSAQNAKRKQQREHTTIETKPTVVSPTIPQEIKPVTTDESDDAKASPPVIPQDVRESVDLEIERMVNESQTTAKEAAVQKRIGGIK